MYYQYLVCCFFHPVRNTIRWSFHFFPLLQLEARHWRDLLLIGKIHSKRRQATNNLCRLVLLLLLFCCMLCFPFRHCFVVVLLATIGFEVETGDLHTMSCLSAGWSSSPHVAICRPDVTNYEDRLPTDVDCPSHGLTSCRTVQTLTLTQDGHVTTAIVL